ncbi:G patch domain-containing protein 1-like [Ptychodera flava]|uniref:G patch domain-containing protein 1-like n=1 Tax=Ptychodera flava TaxID=63121 RepID=UPI00396A2AAF
MDDSDEELAPYGTPLKPIEEDAPRKKPIGLEDQTVHDKQGRRRFHGAFTGGFSAGYYNTVGTKEGWTPSTFVSSRNKRAERDEQRPEQYMDDDDLGEFGIAPRKITATDDFGVGDDRQKISSQSGSVIPGIDILHELIVPAKIPMGVILLRKMGWKEGQGIGPKTKRRAKKGKEARVYGCAPPPVKDGSSSDEDVFAVGHYFAPKDAEIFLFKPKDDTHGIGYRGIDPRTAILRGSTREELFFDPTGKVSRKGISGKAFGVGAFEDDDDDIYSQDSMANYDIELGGKDPTKNYGWTAPKHKKGSSQDYSGNTGKVIDGFQQSGKPKPANKIYAAPALPPDFRPFHKFDPGQQAPSQTTVSTGRFSLSAAQRGAILGEEQLPGPSSVFDVMSKEDKERVKNTSEILKSNSATPQPPAPSQTAATVPPFQKPLFTGALGGFKPFAKDPAKQKRYEEFLEMKKAGKKDAGSIPLGSMTEWEREHEKEEFARAAALYQPLNNMMAARFTSAKYNDDTDTVEVSEQPEGDKTDQMKAAEMKMYGKLTRDVLEWHPDRLLCKRFNVPDPYPESSTVGLPKVKKDKISVFNFLNTTWEQPKQQQSVGVAKTPSQSQLALPAPAATTPLNLFSNLRDPASSQVPASSVARLPSFVSTGASTETKETSSGDAAIATVSHSAQESYETKEKAPVESDERPPMDLFQAIFADSESEDSSSSESSDNDGNDKESNDEVDSNKKAESQPQDRHIDPSGGIDRNRIDSDSQGRSTELISQQLSSIFGSELSASETHSEYKREERFLQSRETATSPPCSKKTESDRQDCAKVNIFGPALPPTMQQGPSASHDRDCLAERTLYDRMDRKDRKRKSNDEDTEHRKHKHKRKDRKKDKKKEKDKRSHSKKSKDKKKKSKKHKHKHKHKSRHKRDESDDDADASSSLSDSDQDSVDSVQLLQRLKSLPSHRRPTAADFM